MRKYHPGDQIKKNENDMTYDMRKGAYSVLVGKPDENRQFGRWNRWEGNIKITLKETQKSMDSTDLVQDGDRWWAVVNAATKHHI